MSAPPEAADTSDRSRRGGSAANAAGTADYGGGSAPPRLAAAAFVEAAAPGARDDSADPPAPAPPLHRARSAAEVLREACDFAPPAPRRPRPPDGAPRYPSLGRVASSDAASDGTDVGKKAAASSSSAARAAAEGPSDETVPDAPAEGLGDPAGYAVAAAAVVEEEEEAGPPNDLHGYDAEILAMKLRAARGYDSHSEMRDAPAPQPHDSVLQYYRRNQEYFRNQAVRSIDASGVDPSHVSSEEIEQEGQNLARRQFDSSFPVQLEAEVFSVTSAEAIAVIDANKSIRDAVNGERAPTAETTAATPAAASVSVSLPVQEGAAAEATVIDSAPIDQSQTEGEVPTWKYFDAEEAEILQESSAATVVSVSRDRKPAASAGFSHGARDEDLRATRDILQEEAEILDIQEEQYIHPLELQDDGATAELVGQDYAVGVAILHGTSRRSAGLQPVQVEGNLRTSSDVAVGHANGQRNSSRADAEFLATVVHGDYTALQQLQDVGPIVTAEPVATIIGSNDDFISSVAENGHVATAEVLAQPVDESINGRQSSQVHSYKDEEWLRNPAGGLISPTMAQIQPSNNRNAAEKTVESEKSDDSAPDWLHIENARAHFVSPPPPQRFGSSGGTVDRETSSSAAASQDRVGNRISSTIARGTNNVMESLFGEERPGLPFMNRRGGSSSPVDRAAQAIRPRTLLPWSVIFSPNSRMWVATLQTNQKALDNNNVAEASRSLRAFSLPTEKQAICLAKNWTPPRMIPFTEAKACHIGRTKFALLVRPVHCKNCGVVVCKKCTVQWPSRMLPDTYNRKDAGTLTVCKSCDWLCNAFRLALLDGNFDHAVALFETGNININSPFGNVKGELFFPVHCAVLGGNLQLLRWLVDEHCSPIKSLRVSGKSGQSAGKYTPIVTSKGRSLLGIAMKKGNIPIIRYLVVEKSISVAGEKDITTDMLVSNLQTVLHLLPADVDLLSATAPPPPINSPTSVPGDDVEDPVALSLDEGRSLSQEARNYGAVKSYKAQDETCADDDNNDFDDCVICFDNPIDSVANPCGHQVMCMQCAAHVARCPVCASECTFIKVYKSS